LTRENYRSRDKATRDADTSYADSLSDVVDAIASNPRWRKPAEQLADDLSGCYGPFAVNWRSVGSSTEIVIEGEILSGSGDLMGRSGRSFYRDHDGYHVVHNDGLWLEVAARRRGFATAFYNELNATIAAQASMSSRPTQHWTMVATAGPSTGSTGIHGTSLTRSRISADG